MFGELNPLLTGLVIFLILAASIVIVVSLALSHRNNPRPPVVALPHGADAALWSIVEAVPDPRNHLALTRDLSGEVHITSADREAAAALYSEKPKTERIAPTPRPRQRISRPGVRATRPVAPATTHFVSSRVDSVLARPPASPPQAAPRPPARSEGDPAPLRPASALPQRSKAARPETARPQAKPPVLQLPDDDGPIVARDGTEPESADDRLVRTSEFFFAGEPRLNRF